MVAENSSEWIEEEDLATAGQQVVTIIVVFTTLSCTPQKSSLAQLFYMTRRCQEAMHSVFWLIKTFNLILTLFTLALSSK